MTAASPAPVFWLTGPPGAGKTTIARRLHGALIAGGRAAVVLDGDALRLGLNSDLAFSRADRGENVRRVGEVARLLSEAGITAVVALVSPYRADRERARALLPRGRFLEVHVDAPLAVLEARDPKGLYRRARVGELPDLTGVGSAYEAPSAPELRLDTSACSEDEAVASVLRLWPAAATLPRTDAGGG